MPNFPGPMVYQPAASIMIAVIPMSSLTIYWNKLERTLKLIRRFYCYRIAEKYTGQNTCNKP